MQSASYEGKFLKQSEDLPRTRSGKSPNQSSVVKQTMGSEEEKKKKAALQEGERRAAAERGKSTPADGAREALRFGNGNNDS